MNIADFKDCIQLPFDKLRFEMKIELSKFESPFHK